VRSSHEEDGYVGMTRVCDDSIITRMHVMLRPQKQRIEVVPQPPSPLHPRHLPPPLPSPNQESVMR